MQLNLIFVTTLLLVNCKASDVGINLNPYSSNIDGYKVKEKSDAAAVTQQSFAHSALNALAGIIAKGGNYIIDASSMGGGVLVGRNGQLTPFPSVTNGNSMPDAKAISSQLLQNVRDLALQKHSNPILTYPTNPISKVVPKRVVKPQLMKISRKPHFSVRPVSIPVVKPMQTSLRIKYKPTPGTYTVNDINSMAYVMPDFSLLKFLDLHSSTYDVDFD